MKLTNECIDLLLKFDANQRDTLKRYFKERCAFYCHEDRIGDIWTACDKSRANEDFNDLEIITFNDDEWLEMAICRIAMFDTN